MGERIFQVSMLLQRFVIRLEEIGEHQLDGQPVPPDLIASAAVLAKEYHEITGKDAYEAAVNQWEMERELSEESKPVSVPSPFDQARPLPWTSGNIFFS